MTVSIIVPTYNGAHKLNGVFEALQKQIFKDFELIIVIDGSTDNTLEVINNYKSNFDRIKIITRTNGGRSKVRNTGAKAATGDLLIYFDDDIRPDPDCVSLHVDHHLKHIDSILTGGTREVYNKKAVDSLKYKSDLIVKWTAPLLTYIDNPLKKNNLFITAANFSIPRLLFEKLGGFDERLLDAEDFDLAVKAYKSGVNLYFNDKASGVHDDKANFKLFIRRQRQYNKGHKELIRLNPWMVEEGFIENVFNGPKGFKKTFFRLFTSLFWIKSIDRNLFAFLPKAIKYKLYDIIVTANGIYFPEKISL
jgi:glycosyltransferase involved in cell wall biosynthesis